MNNLEEFFDETARKFIEVNTMFESIILSKDFNELFNITSEVIDKSIYESKIKLYNKILSSLKTYQKLNNCVKLTKKTKKEVEHLFTRQASLCSVSLSESDNLLRGYIVFSTLSYENIKTVLKEKRVNEKASYSKEFWNKKIMLERTREAKLKEFLSGDMNAYLDYCDTSEKLIDLFYNDSIKPSIEIKNYATALDGVKHTINYTKIKEIDFKTFKEVFYKKS